MRNQFPPAAVLETTYRLSYQRLQRLAENTGGKFFKVASYEELPVIYRQIATELPYYYTLGYQPDFSQATEGEYHTIEVRLKEPGLEARNRRGYYYSKDKTTQ
jgi:VWFA-related protein